MMAEDRWDVNKHGCRVIQNLKHTLIIHHLISAFIHLYWSAEQIILARRQRGEKFINCDS